MAFKRKVSIDHMDTVNDLVYKKAKMGEYTDFALECDGVEIPVHKVIVCSQIKAFAAACAGGFKEGCSGVYRIDEFPLSSIRHLVQFLYTGDYGLPNDADKSPSDPDLVLPPSLSLSPSSSSSSSSSSAAATTAAITTAAVTEDLSKNLVAHIHMAEIADYFNVPGLKELVHKKVDETLQLPWSPEGFADAVTMAFNIGDNGVLRDRLAATVADHLDDFLGTDSRMDLFTHDASFQVLRRLNEQLKESERRTKGLQRQPKRSLELQRLNEKLKESERRTKELQRQPKKSPELQRLNEKLKESERRTKELQRQPKKSPELQRLNEKLKESERRTKELQRQPKKSLELQTRLAQQLGSERELSNGIILS
ncbi:uncharacterized protein BO95DRAFT_461866 [Aspergillus brunneoviolaceus CBS 621.78]|uniref:Uncharacterized protein n=1 Tax=Aspergillus brunneoviolaceus CBS 621.78 TaxID=1450534 RepID=A0ACD1GF53_9EURO|nr:hypothetical protein BO95DRAFT_461866 [Aspergillus brunneoviolaceus CBS 621.78]RAH47800.1 hypothetical protein BO95DRAFT_461866 [Aspergillus brunneoviolaceus CBS 621.78]